MPKASGEGDEDYGMKCSVLVQSLCSSLSCAHRDHKVRPGVSNVFPICGILGLSFDSTLLSPVLSFGLLPLWSVDCRMNQTLLMI